MFDKIINLLKSKTGSGFDPSVFNDTVALETEWSPLSPGGSNFKTHKLVQINMNRYEFRAGLGMKLFAGVFSLFGISFALISGFVMTASGEVPLAAVIAVSFFCLLFASVGVIIYYFAGKPRVFDKDTGFYWKGRSEPNIMINPEYQNFTKLSDIYAVQIISEWVRGNKNSYTSYELNLVTRDKKRINVIDHGNLNSIVEDAETISEFLGVKLWNAVNV